MSLSKKEKIILAGCKILHKLFHIFPLKKQAVFSSFGGTEYSDNPKAISEALHEMDTNYRFVWMLPDHYGRDIPSYIITAKRYSLKALYYYATSKIIVDNFSIPQWFVKRDGQKYIQTWHGDRGFKKILYDSTFIDKDFYRPEKDICDLMVAGSKRGYDKFRSAFRYDGEILEVGSPRNDILVHPDRNKASEIKRQYSVDDNTNVLLYAPTYRRKENKGYHIKGLDIPRLLDELSRITNSRWVCFLRAHKASHGFDRVEQNERLIDVTSYPDIIDLMLASDFLITDYSSSAGDFALTGKPIVLFREDTEEYTDKDRTFYFDISETPFKIASNQKEIVEKFEKLYIDDSARKNCQDILDFYGCYETGHAAQECAEWIVDNVK